VAGLANDQYVMAFGLLQPPPQGSDRHFPLCRGPASGLVVAGQVGARLTLCITPASKRFIRPRALRLNPSLTTAYSVGFKYLCTGLLSAYQKFVGDLGTGTFQQTGGTNAIALQLIVDDHGTYMLSGGSLSSTLQVYVDSSAPGSIQSGGTNSISGNGLYLGVKLGSTGSYTLTSSATII